MDEELRKQMEAKWKASQASETSCTGNGRGAEAVPSADAVSAGQLDVDAIKAKQAADYEAYRREMAERYAKSNASRAAAEPVAEPASEPVAEPPKAPDVPQMQQQRESPPKSPCTAARELREQQDREYQEALAADQAAAGVAPPSSSPAPTYPPAYAAPLPAEAPAADTDREQEIRRAQIAELRARRAQQSAGGSAAAAAAATPGNTEDQVGAPSGAGSGAGIVRDQVTGEMRPSEAQGRVQRLTDDVPGGMGMGMGMGMPPNMSHAGRGAEGGRRPELPAQLQQALSASQLELLYEAMGEMGGGGFQPGMMGGPPAVPGGMPMPDDAMGDFPMGGMAGMGGMGGGGVQPPRRAPPPFGGGYDDGDGMPSNWDPRNARQTEGEQELHRRQVAELRARSRSQARTSGSQEAGGGASSGSGAGDAGAAGSEGSGGMVRDEVTGEMRPAAAQGQVQRLTDDVPGGGAGPGRFGGVFPPFGGPPGGFPGLPGAGGGDDVPMTLREMAMREQSLEGYGRPGMGGGMPPWAQFGREPEGGVTTAAIEQNSFTFDYELPAPDSELAAQAATDVSLARCSVCLCDLEQGDSCRRLPCLHMFHKDCIDDWLKRNRSCPVCKTDIMTGASETRRELGEEQCSAAAMPGEPDWQPPGFGEELGPAAGMPGGFGLGPARQRRQPGVGFGVQPSPSAGAGAAGAAGAARGYFDRGGYRGGAGAGPGMAFDRDGPPPGIFGDDGPPLGIFARGGPPAGQRMMAGGGAGGASPAAAAAAARAMEMRRALGEEEGEGAEMVEDEITGERRPAAAQGRVERLDGGDEGDLWRGMHGLGIGAVGGQGYQAQGYGSYSGGRGPAMTPYYEDMFRSRGPLGAMRPGRAPPASAHGAPAGSGYGGASNAATLGGLGGGGGEGGGGGRAGGWGHPVPRALGPMGGGGRVGNTGGVGPGGSMAEQLLRHARMQQQMAMQAMAQGAMSEPRPEPGRGPGGGARGEWSHFFQDR